MTDPNYTHITLVCDRSGSMQSVRYDAEGAVNAFIEEQKSIDKPCSLYLVDFDAPHGGWSDDWYRTVHNGPIGTAPKYSLHPRGGTSLFDAINRAIDETGESLRKLPENKRPGMVFFVVQTDGEENRSTFTTLEFLRSKIKEQESKYEWNFIFLSSGPDAFAQGMNLGFRHNTETSGHRQTYAGMYLNNSGTIKQARMANSVAGVQWVSKVADDGTVTHESS